MAVACEDQRAGGPGVQREREGRKRRSDAKEGRREVGGSRAWSQSWDGGLCGERGGRQSGGCCRSRGGQDPPGKSVCAGKERERARLGGREADNSLFK